MIQRIQSIYLLLSTGLLITGMCLPSGYFHSEDMAMRYTFKALGVNMNGSLHSTWGLFAILLLCAIMSFATIFFYKKRILQIRMTIFNSILLAGYYLAFIAFVCLLANKPELRSFRISWALAFPALAIFFNYLAVRAIGRDEIMIKAADRLR